MFSKIRPKGFFDVKCWKNFKKEVLLWEMNFKNIVVDEGMIDVLSTIFSSGWYIGLKGSNEIPAAGWTASGIGTDFTELIQYTEAVRQTWNPGTITTKTPSNVSSPVEFSINDSATFYGAFMINNNTKGGTTGILWCCADALASQSVVAGNIIQIVYTIIMADDGV